MRKGDLPSVQPEFCKKEKVPTTKQPKMNIEIYVTNYINNKMLGKQARLYIFSGEDIDHGVLFVKMQQYLSDNSIDLCPNVPIKYQ